jgi:hypothetical protein
MCVCVCMYVCMYVCICVMCAYVCLNARVCLCACVYMYVSMYYVFVYAIHPQENRQKIMITFILQWNEGIHTKTNDISNIYASLITFLQNLHPDLRNSAIIAEFLRGFYGRSPFNLLATSFECFLDWISRQTRSGDLSDDLSRVRTSGSLRGSNPYCRVDMRAAPSRFVFLCTRNQTVNPTGTNFPISQNLHHLLDRTVPHSNCAAISLTVILRSCLMNSSTFCLLRSVGLGWPQRGWSAMSVFPSLKFFTHPLALVVPMQTSPYTTQSLVDDSCRVSLLHKKFNESTQTKWHVVDSHFLAVYDGNVRDAHALVLLSSCLRIKIPLMIL